MNRVWELDREKEREVSKQTMRSSSGCGAHAMNIESNERPANTSETI